MSSGLLRKLAWPPIATYFLIEGLNVKPGIPGASRRTANELNAAVAASLFCGLIILTIADAVLDFPTKTKPALYLISAAIFLPPVIITHYVMRTPEVSRFRSDYEMMSRPERASYVATHVLVTIIAYAAFMWS